MKYIHSPTYSHAFWLIRSKSIKILILLVLFIIIAKILSLNIFNYIFTLIEGDIKILIIIIAKILFEILIIKSKNVINLYKF